jgi:hypothetical protein
VHTNAKIGLLHDTPGPGVMVPVFGAAALGVNAAISRVADSTEPPDELPSAVGGTAFAPREEHPVPVRIAAAAIAAAVARKPRKGNRPREKRGTFNTCTLHSEMNRSV